MFQKIIDFFRSLFGMSRTTKPTVETPKVDDLTAINPEEPQDGSEITADTIVVVVNPEELVVLDEIDDIEAPTTSTIPPTTGSVDVVIVTTPTEEPSSPNTGEATENEPVAAGHKARFMWCIDNGHGSKTAGKRSPKLPDGKQLMEYEFNRDIVKRITKSLDELGVKYFNVVPEVDIDNFLEGRVDRANKKQSTLPKLFVSVHSNAAPAPAGKWSDPDINGIETWFFHNSAKGRKLASVFQKHLIAKTGWKNRMIKSQASQQFYVLRNTNMTAILTENGFYNNKAQCQELLKDSVRQKIADAHVEAILEIEKKGIV